MMKGLFILALVVCAVLADNYMCPDKGDAFECFESAPETRFCVTNGKEEKVICSKCKRKYEYCSEGFKVSRYPDRQCGAGWESTPCTSDNSHVPDTM